MPNDSHVLPWAGLRCYQLGRYPESAAFPRVGMNGIYQRSLRDTGVNHSLFHQMIME